MAFSDAKKIYMKNQKLGDFPMLGTNNKQINFSEVLKLMEDMKKKDSN